MWGALHSTLKSSSHRKMKRLIISLKSETTVEITQNFMAGARSCIFVSPQSSGAEALSSLW